MIRYFRPITLLLFAFSLCIANATQPQVYSDSNLNMPTAWKECKTDNQCVQIPNGCWFGAVNVNYEKEATVLAIKKAGDPKTLNCYYPRMKKTWISAVCLENKCTVVGAEK